MAFRCSHCNYRSVKWLGRCPSCGEWDTFAEETDLAAEGKTASDSWIGGDLQPITAIDLGEIARLPTGFQEVDRLLGGGLVPGGVILFGGEPGVGKSTLLLQLAQNLSSQYGNVLYVSGEESAAQIKLRASRLGVENDHLYILSEQSLPRIVEAVERISPTVLIVDSIQAVVSDVVPGEAGSIRQLREASAELTRLTKRRRMTTFLVGHITKEGSFAGPKMIEHLVDVAIYLEGSRGEDVRILRSVKNRFGATHEVAVFQMLSLGLKEISNPSRFFLEDQEQEPRAGTVVVPVLEGSRPILVELQALVSPTGGYGVPQRRCTGLDYNRILLLLAVIERRLGIHTAGADVYLSLAGGLETRERAVDLGVVAAIVSSLRDRAIAARTTVVGEVGLSGEVRGVKRLRERVNEAAKLGYVRAIVPTKPKLPPKAKAEIVPVKDIEETMDVLALR
jgi:DNA repair protein RadA/Sms